jgi:hypothetical protein
MTKLLGNFLLSDKTFGVLNSPDFDESEKWVVRWQFSLLGGFSLALAIVIAHADPDNLEILRKGYPVEVNGYERWALGVEPKIAPRLRAAGLHI